MREKILVSLGMHSNCESAKVIKDEPGWLTGMITILGNHGEMLIHVGWVLQPL